MNTEPVALRGHFNALLWSSEVQRAQFQRNNDKEGRRDKGVSLCLLTPSVLQTYTKSKPRTPRSHVQKHTRKHSTIRGTVCNSRAVSDQTNGFKTPTSLTGRARPQRHKDRIE